MLILRHSHENGLSAQSIAGSEEPAIRK